MDPIANLEEQRRLAARLLADDDDIPDDELMADAMRLAELVQALDEWLAGGGFSPWAARRAPRSTRARRGPKGRG